MKILAAALLWLSCSASALAAGTLSVCDDVQDPMTLDPQKEFSEKNHTIVQQIFEGLVRFGPTGSIEPALATSWKRIDDLTMQFQLRQGVRFHNGEPFDARSVKFSIERYLDEKTQFPAYGYIQSLSRVDIISDHLINVVTKVPDGLLLNRLAGFILIVPSGYYASQAVETLKERPIGTGAFKFDSWAKGSRLLLKANTSYWDPGLPKVESLVFKFIPAEEQVAALLAGEVDILTNVPGTRTLEVQSHPATKVIKSPSLYTMAANFNIGRKPLSNKRVRRALNLAVNKDDLIRYDVFGNGIPVGTLSLDGEFGHDAAVKPYPFQPNEARKILAEEGYPKGFELNVLLKLNAERTGRILAKHLEKIGVRLRFTLTSDADLFRHLSDRNKWDMAIYSCPDPMYHSYFIPSIFVAGGSPFALHPDLGIDERMIRMVSTLDLDQQRGISEEMDRYIHEEALALPTYQRLGVFGLRRAVSFTPYLSGMPYFSGTSIDEKP